MAFFDPSSSSLIGDYIGMESCNDLETSEDFFSKLLENGQRYCRRDKMASNEREEKEFPPPIPLLARTGNLHPHMPWILKRQYTADGRLILTEERVRHHEYFKAQRENGRLTLQLVVLDDEGHPAEDDYYKENAEDPCTEDQENEVDYNCDHVDANYEEKGNDQIDRNMLEASIAARSTEKAEEGSCIAGHDDREGCDNKYDQSMLAESVAKLACSVTDPTVENGLGVNGSPRKCLEYKGMGSNSTCIFPVPVPALRPVQS